MKRLIFLLLVTLYCNVLNSQERPSWIENIPRDSSEIKYFFGYGQGTTIGNARKNSVNNAIKNIEIDSIALLNDRYLDYQLSVVFNFEVYFKFNDKNEIENKNEIPPFSGFRFQYGHYNTNIEINLVKEYSNLLNNGNYEYYMLLSISNIDLIRLKNNLLGNYTAFANDRSLDRAIYNAANILIANLPKNISVVTVATGDTGLVILEEYIMEEMITYLLRTPNIYVLDRRSLDDIRREQQFQLSGDVDDNAIVSIGNFLGADSVITVNITGIQRQSTLHIKVIDVKTARLLVQTSRDFEWQFDEGDGLWKK